MDFNIINEYTNFIKKELLELYKIIFDKDYVKRLIDPFLTKYINVRYYNETVHPYTKDNINRIGKELEDTYKLLLTKDNEELLKNIYSVFGYILYFDDLVTIEPDQDIISIFIQDENLKIENRDKELKKALNNWYRTFKKRKQAFIDTINTDKFFLEYTRIRSSLYGVNLEHDVSISSLYSDSAIEKAFNSESVCTNATQMIIILCLNQILKNAINLNFKDKYLVNFPDSLWDKDKKSTRFFKMANNPLALKHIIFEVTYSNYKNNKTKIKDLIKEGYLFIIKIDENFEDEDIADLPLFYSIMINAKTEYIDTLLHDPSISSIPIIKVR